MTRASWKGPFIHNSNSRDSYILPVSIGKTIYIYTGKRKMRFSPKQFMTGFKYGEFIFSRKTVNHKTKNKALRGKKNTKSKKN